MDYATYAEAVQTAKQIYDKMRSSPDGARDARVRDFPSRAKGQMTNNYLQFDNIRAAALAGDFTLIRIGYYRNEALLTARAENNQGRRKFIAWAVAQLKERHPEHICQEELLQIWNALPQDERHRITTASVKGFFKAVGGVRLCMADLQTRALQELGAPHAGVGSAPGAGTGEGGEHQSGSGLGESGDDWGRNDHLGGLEDESNAEYFS
jgi:hypothetical protein